MARYTIDVDDAFNKVLMALAQAKGVTPEEIIRNSVSTYDYLSKQAPANDPTRNVAIADATGNVIKNVTLP